MKNCEITLYQKKSKTTDSDKIPVGAYFVVPSDDNGKLYQKIQSGSPQHRYVDCEAGSVCYTNINGALQVYPKISVEVDE